MTNFGGKSDSPLVLKQRLQAAIVGLQSQLPQGVDLQLSDVHWSGPKLVAELEGFLGSFTAVEQARLAYEAALQAREQILPQAKDMLAQLRGALIAFHGSKSPLLGHYGMGAHVRKRQTAEMKLLAAAKRTLTRELRGTVGKAAKAKLKALGTPHVSVGPHGTTIAPGASEVDAAEASPAAPEVLPKR